VAAAAAATQEAAADTAEAATTSSTAPLSSGQGGDSGNVAVSEAEAAPDENIPTSNEEDIFTHCYFQKKYFDLDAQVAHEQEPRWNEGKGSESAFQATPDRLPSFLALPAEDLA
jgi:hypothetical protein